LLVEKEAFSKAEIKISAYFTIAIKPLVFDPHISKKY
jgi:hypothetical protein